MGFRFRKKIRIAPGIAINISKSGVSTSIGRNGATTNISKRGVKTTIGIPGTGLSWSTGYGKRNHPNSLASGTDGDYKPRKEGFNFWRLFVFLVVSYLLICIFKN